MRYVSGFGEMQLALREELFDLVTLDVMLPDANGLEILVWLNENYPETGVIMATAMGDLGTVLQAMRLGAINYLLKPFNLDLVSQEIRVAMERQRLAAENRSYQRELEAKVAAQTTQLQEAYDLLRLQVKELEGTR